MTKTQQASGSALMLAAVGVVFGDLETSPPYARQEVFSCNRGLGARHATVLGVLSRVCTRVPRRAAAPSP